MFNVGHQAFVRRAETQGVDTLTDQLVAGIGVTGQRVVPDVDEPDRQPSLRHVGVGLQAAIARRAAAQALAQGLEDLVRFGLTIPRQLGQVVDLGAPLAHPVDMQPGEDLDQADAGLDRGLWEFVRWTQEQLPAHRLVGHFAQPERALGQVARDTRVDPVDLARSLVQCGVKLAAQQRQFAGVDVGDCILFTGEFGQQAVASGELGDQCITLFDDALEFPLRPGVEQADLGIAPAPLAAQPGHLPVAPVGHSTAAHQAMPGFEVEGAPCQLQSLGLVARSQIAGDALQDQQVRVDAVRIGLVAAVYRALGFHAQPVDVGVFGGICLEQHQLEQ